MSKEDWSDIASPVTASMDDWSDIASPVGKKKETSSAARRIADVPLGIAKGIADLPGAAVGLLDIPTNGLAGKAVDAVVNPIGEAADAVGVPNWARPTQLSNTLGDLYSPEMKQAKQNVHEAFVRGEQNAADAGGGTLEKFIGGIAEGAPAFIKNPAAAVALATENYGGMKAIAKGTAKMLAPAAAKYGEAVKAGTMTQEAADAALANSAGRYSAVNEGLLTAGQNTQQVEHENPDASFADRAMQGVAGAITGGISRGVSKIPRLGDVEANMALRDVGSTAKTGLSGGRLAAAGKSAFSEGVLEELPQSMQEQVWQNLGTNKPWDSGLAEQAVSGLVAGGAMGGAMGALSAKPGAEKNDSPIVPIPKESINLVTDPDPLQERIDSLLGIGNKPMNDTERTQYAKDLESAFGEVVGHVSGKDGLEIPVTMEDYLRSQLASADITRDRPKAENAVEQSANRLQQLADEESTQQPDIAPPGMGIAAAPIIPVVGALSAVANMAVQSGAHAQTQMQQASAQPQEKANANEPAIQRNAGKIQRSSSGGGSANSESGQQDFGAIRQAVEQQYEAFTEAASTVAPNISPAAPSIPAQAPNIEGRPDVAQPAQVAKEAPQTNAPKAGAASPQATSQGQGIDLSNRTHAQLNYLTQHGKNGHKEAAVAELAKRGIEISAPKASADSESVPALKAGNSGNQAPKLGDFIEGPNGYRIRIDEHKKGSNQLDPVADAGALVYEVRKGSGDANPLTMVLNKDGKLVDKKSVMNADGSSNGTAFVPPGAVSRGQLVELLQARAKTETGSAERSSIDQKIKDLVTRYTNKPEAAPVKSEQPQQVKGAENGQAETEVLKQPGAVSNAAPVEDPIGWTRMTTVQRESLVSRSGWAGKTRGLNLIGVRIARTAWDDMTEANRAKLIAANQDTIKNEKPAAATVSKTESVSEQAPIKKDVAVDAGSDPDLNIEKRILFAADSIDKLRKVDVERVLAQGNIDRQKMAEYIKRKRPDLSGEVDDVMAELQPSVSQPKTDAAHEAKQDKAPASKPKPARNKIDAENDSLFVAIAKAGGMDTDELLGNGFDAADITYESTAKVSKKSGALGKKPRRPISMGFNLPLHKKGGMSFDGMLESMKQYGYMPEDATKNDAIDLFKQELAGDPVYTAQAIEFRRDQDQEEFDKQMAKEQDRIDAELAAQEIAEDDAGFNELSLDEQSLASDFAEFAFGENGKQDDNATRAGMRALGFTEEEINDELAKNSQSQRESEEIAGRPGQEGGADRNGNRAQDAQARERDGEEGITFKEGKGLAKGKWFAVSVGEMSNAEDTKEKAAESLRSILATKKANEDRRVALDELAKSVAEKIKAGEQPTDKDLYDLFGLEKYQDYVFQEAVGTFLVKHLGVSRNKIHESLGKAGGVRRSDFGVERNIAYPRKLHEVFGKGFDLAGQTNSQAAEEFAQQQTGENGAPTKAQADKERDAVPFSLGMQSQPKPQGVQTGLFTADGRVSVEAKPADTADAKIDKSDDWLAELFGDPQSAEDKAINESQLAQQAQDKADRVDAAIAMLTGEIEATNAVAAELAARKYKSNRKQIELVGDGPGKNGSMSISAINESRKRRAIEASLNASSSIKQAIEFIAENPDGAFKQVADMESAVTKQFNEGFFGPSANLDRQLDMAVGSLIESGSYSGEGSAGRKLRMAASAYATVDAKKEAKPEAKPDPKPKAAKAPKIETVSDMTQSLAKAGYGHGTLPMNRSEIRVGLNMSAPFSDQRFEAVINLRGGKWNVSEVEVPDLKSEGMRDAMNKFRADLADLNEGRYPDEEAKKPDSAKTADAGEELTYNKRNRRTGGLKWDDIKDRNAALRIKEVVKAKVYPKPDYQALVDGGMKDVVAHIVKQAYDSIAPSPKLKRGAEPTDEALQSYIDAVNRVMDGVMKWANDSAAVAKWAEKQSRSGSISVSELAAASSLLDTVYPEGWKTHRDELIMLGGNKLLSKLQPGYDEVGRAMKDIKLGWPAKSEAWQKQGFKVVNVDSLTIDLYSSPSRPNRAAYVSGMLSVGKQRIDSFVINGTENKEDTTVQEVVADRKRELEGKSVLLDKSNRIVGVYPDEDSATEAARDKAKKETGEKISEKGVSVEMAERLGIEHRMPGDDITSERLKETFGFRGVNFGNWMQGDTKSKVNERQLHLNHLYDAFMDLAQLLNLPPKAMSLNGMLGIAVGAQGSGKALAHFVPGVNEINVTRTKGAGALAHEWGHALDHYFATMGGLDRQKQPYLSAHVGTLNNRIENGRYVRTPVALADVRPEIAGQFQSIVEAMTKRHETDAEYMARIRGEKDIAGRLVAEEIKEIVASIGEAKTGWGTPELVAKVRGLAARIASIDYGDGRVSMGGTEVPAVVAEIADAYQEASGAPLKNVNALGYHADRYRVISGILESTESREPRTVPTDYKRASDAADAKKKPYWSTKLEMFARAFDAYVVDSLAEKAASNTYLAGIEAVAPQGDERKTIGKAFDFLFAELKTKETEQGVMLYNQASAGKISPADKAIYGMSAEGKSAAEILKFIASASRSPFNRQVAKLLLKTGIAPSVTVGDSKTWKISDAKSGETFAAAYDPKTDTVALFRPASAERNMLHELVHAASLKALAKKGMASAQMKALFAHVEKTGKLTGMYGIRNVDEFIAEAFSNPKFQAMLKQVSAMPLGGKPSSAWDWFIRVVRGILGLKQGQDNALSQALDIGVGVMRENMKLNGDLKNGNVRGMADKSNVAGTQAPTSAGDGSTGSATIEVDGVLRSTLNSNGKPIHPTEEGVRNFWRWFGDSKVVDSEGRPHIVYHGTTSEFTAFDRSERGTNTNASGAERGFFFAGDSSDSHLYIEIAQARASKNYESEPEGRILNVYLKAENPLILTPFEEANVDEDTVNDLIDADPIALDYAVDNGFDAVIWPHGNMNNSAYTAVVFQPDQIRFTNPNEPSASAGSGADIRYNVADEGWNVSEQAKKVVMRLAGRPMADPSDPFAAENSRLREQDQSLWSKAKKQLRRYLAPGGLLPQSVFAEKIKRDSEFQAVEFDIRHLIGGLEQAVKADFGIAFDKLSKEQMRPITEALAGNVPASLPDATKTAAVAMRQYIDGMSTEYLKIIQQKIDTKMLKAIESGKDSDKAQAINEIELFEKIKGNIGRYVHRSYQAFDDPKWFEKVPAPVLNASRLYLKQGYMEAGETDAKAAQLAEVTLHEILKNGTAYDSMESFIAESKLGAKDLSVLMRRKEVPTQIRALLGEYQDARLNFTKSATKMGRLIWNTRFLDRVRDIGIGSFFFEGKDRPPEATTQIAAGGSEVYAPLNGLWTFPEIAQSFKDALGKEQMSDLYRAIVRANGLVKYGKTILAPTTAMRNWQSAMFFSLANGHFDLTQMKKSISAFREQVSQKATGQDLKYLRHLKQLGVVYDTPYAGEMARLMEDARMDELLSSDKGDAVRWFRKANQLAQGFYTFGDDFWKIIGFENEKAGLMKAGLSLQEAEAEAAKRIRDTYPTYSMVGRGVQWLSRFPLAGTFVSFPAEIIRTSSNMLRTVVADLKSDNPKLRELGMKRAAGMAFVSAAFYGLAALSMAMAGVGDDEDEAIRDLAPEWQKNSTFLYLGRDEKGNLRYFDMSFLDPYGYWKRPITAILRNQPWEDSLASGLRGMLEPFLGADISAKAIFEAVANQKENGSKVYKEKDGSIDQAIDIADHLRKALQPGVVGNVERLVKAAGDVRKSSGQPYSMEDELVALAGWRATTIDPKTALYYRSFDFTDSISEARKTLTDTLRDANSVSPEDIKDAKARAASKQEQAFKEMSRLIGAAEAAGMSKMQIVQTMRLSNISQANIAALMRGSTPDVSITPQLAARAVRQARQMRGPEYAAEVFDRYRQAMAN